MDFANEHLREGHEARRRLAEQAWDRYQTALKREPQADAQSLFVDTIAYLLIEHDMRWIEAGWTTSKLKN